MKPDKPTYPCDADRHRGVLTRQWAAEVVRARRLVETPGKTPCGPVRTISGRSEITPPLLTDRERGQGDSTNAKMHKLIGKYRDFALVLNRDRE